MRATLFTRVGPALLALSLLLPVSGALAADGGSDCAPAAGFGFVCGPQAAEDLLHLPGTPWLIASSFVPGEGLLGIDTGAKTWKALYPAEAPRADHDAERYGACATPPDPAAFVTHGLNLRTGEDGRTTLYVVGHGGREAIEVFDVAADGETPVLTWKGCVPIPGAQEANSVASLADGSLLATVPLEHGRDISEALGTEATGAVYAWSPGDETFTRVEGTGLPYGNGIEVSDDGSEFYVASSGRMTVLAFSNENPARRLRESAPLDFVPDNLRRGPDGRLYTAGLVAMDETCGNLRVGQVFDFGHFASCPRPFVVRAVDPATLEGSDVARGPALERFSNITIGIPVDGQVWIGTFGGDRVAYTQPASGD